MKRVFWIFRAITYRVLFPKIRFFYFGSPILVTGVRRWCVEKNVGIFPMARIEIGKGGLLKIGKNTRIGHMVFIEGNNSIIIGENCVLSSNVYISTTDYNWKHTGTVGFKASESPSKSVVIGDNVFIGINSVILPGVTIESNSVIGANSVVTRNVKGGSIVYGKY